MKDVATAQNISKYAFVSRSKINAHWNRFETRARKHYYTSINFVYRLCRRYMHFTSSLLFFPPFANPSDTHILFGRGPVGICVVRVFAGREREKGSGMDSATRSWCNCMLIERASEYGIRMKAIRFDIAFCLRSSPLRYSPLPSSSGHLLRIHLARSPALSLSSSIRATKTRLLRRRCMKIENNPFSVLF